MSLILSDGPEGQFEGYASVFGAMSLFTPTSPEVTLTSRTRELEPKSPVAQNWASLPMRSKPLANLATGLPMNAACIARPCFALRAASLEATRD